MDIGPTGGVSGPDRINGKKPERARPVDRPTGSPPPSDKLEISDEGKFRSEVLSVPPTRFDKIEMIRQLIESGQFETDERMEGAIEELLRTHPELLA